MATSKQIGGYNTDLFVASEIDDSCKCSICHNLFRDPIELACQHIYCKSCIIQVLNSHAVCPECKQEVDKTKDGDWMFELPRRYFTKMHSNLRLKCDMEGCDHICAIETYKNHQSSCEFNPNRVVKCDKCKTEMVAYEKNDHDCVQSLLKQSNEFKQRMEKNVFDLQESRATNNIVAKLELRIKELEDKCLISIKCKRDDDGEELTMIVKESETIKNVSDKFIKQLGDGDRCISRALLQASGVHNQEVNLDMNKTLKENKVTDGNQILFDNCCVM